MLKNYFTSPLIAPALVLAVLAFSFLGIAFNTAQVIDAILDGWFNTVTYCVYAFSFGIMISHLEPFQTKREKTHLSIFIFLFFAALLREMGIQHWLTTTDTTAFKLRFFTNPNNPVSEKIIAGILLLTTICCVIYLTYCYLPKIWKGFFKFHTLAWTAATLGGTGIVCKIADRMPSHLSHMNLALSDLMKSYFELFEETTELCLPLLCALWFWQYHNLKK